MPRRDFLHVCTGAVATLGSAIAVWPAVAQAAPRSGAPPNPVIVDLTPIQPGQMVRVAWRGQPVVIRHRTADEIVRARAAPVEGLRDKLARNAALPAKAIASDENRTLAKHPQWLVVIGACTHLGCLLRSDVGDDGTPDFGWFCECHAARFDLSGRVRSGPAYANLPVPPYRMLPRNRIEIGRT